MTQQSRRGWKFIVLEKSHQTDTEHSELSYHLACFAVFDQSGSSDFES